MTALQTPAFWRLGSAVIQRIDETSVDLPARQLLPTMPDELYPAEILTLSIHSWLVRYRDRIVLVDAGIGNDKPRPFRAFDRLQTPWLDRLGAAGVTPEQVTDVLITHLHPDHVGWLTRLVDDDWRSTFPNAHIFVPRACYDYLRSDAGRSDRNAALVADSVQPVVQAGQVTFIGSDGLAETTHPASPLPPGFTFHASPGHSADHCSIRFEDGGESAWFAGDVVHHELQLLAPAHSSMFCAAAEPAERSRRAILDQAAAENALYCSSHFSAPSAGRVLVAADRYEWRYESPASA